MSRAKKLLFYNFNSFNSIENKNNKKLEFENLTQYNLTQLRTIQWLLFGVILEKLILTLLQLRDPLDMLFMFTFYIVILRYLRTKFIDKVSLYLILIFIGWRFFGFVRATFYAEGYFVWKLMFKEVYIFLFYFIIIFSTDLNVIKPLFRWYFLFFVFAVLASIAIAGTPLFYDYMPFTILFLFFPLLPKEKKWLILGIVLFYFMWLKQRNDLAKVFFVTFNMIAFGYFYKWIPKWSIKFTYFSFLIFPILFLYLGVSGTFNVFKMKDYIGGDYEQVNKTKNGEEEDEDLEADTRTAIYENVFFTMGKYNAWLLGRSPAYGDEGVEGFWGVDETTGLVGRYGNEVGILDILLWYGIVGVVLYFFIFIRAGYLAIFRSKNKYSKAIGIYVAFLWMWSFIWEKPMTEVFYMTDLILLGLCFSTTFREFSDDEVSKWVKSIFIVEPKFKKLQHESSLVVKRNIP